MIILLDYNPNSNYNKIFHIWTYIYIPFQELIDNYQEELSKSMWKLLKSKSNQGNKMDWHWSFPALV